MRFAIHVAAALVIVLGAAACSSDAAPGSATGRAPSAAPTTADRSSTPQAEVSPMAASPTPSGSTASPSTAAAGPFVLKSSAFEDGGAIPTEYTCDGANVSPPLTWTGVPSGSAALALFVDDPDARDFVHWIVLDLPGSDGNLPRGVSPTAASPQQGRNGFGNVGWGGPCPPSGTHHYRFVLTALGAPLGLGDNPSGEAVREALGRATVLGTATLTATYHRG
jgi:Raf kinase inhibitor-like YbhB/YbcL family protein